MATDSLAMYRFEELLYRIPELEWKEIETPQVVADREVLMTWASARLGCTVRNFNSGVPMRSVSMYRKWWIK